MRLRAVLLLATLLPVLTLADDSLTVAVASNFQFAVIKVAARFTAATDIDVDIVAGSTGKLYAQIVNGAPYDIFLAADKARPRKLVEDGIASAESFWIYATGQLVLWSNHPKFADRDCYRDLIEGNYSYLAIANPGIAPYGDVAREFLISRGLWESAQDKLVFGENISQAFQFVASGNATMGLLAASQVAAKPQMQSSCYRRLQSKAGQPMSVQQGAVILIRSKSSSTARRFMEFMQTKEIATLLENSGYGIAPVAAGH